MLTVPELTLLFLCVLVLLGAAFVWMFWALEHRVPNPRRSSDRLGWYVAVVMILFP